MGDQCFQGVWPIVDLDVDLDDLIEQARGDLAVMLHRGRYVQDGPVAWRVHSDPQPTLVATCNVRAAT